MERKIFGTLLWVLTICAASFGQSAFQDITPGASTRNDVERVWGQPVRNINATRCEYKAPAGIASLEVEYQTGSTVVERIEVNFVRPGSRAAVIQKFDLPQKPDATKQSADQKLVEYFGGESSLALTYVSSDVSSGVSRIGYYSRELFESEVAKLRPNPQGQPQTNAATQNLAGGSSVMPSQPATQSNAKELFVPEGTEFTAVTTEKISSKSAIVGDRIILKVDEQVVVKGRVVINKGTTVRGSIASAEKSGIMGKGGKLAIRIESTTAVDGQEIKLRASKGKEGGSAAVSTVALTMLFGPLGLLKKGSEATIKEGTKIKIYTDEEKKVLPKEQ